MEFSPSNPIVRLCIQGMTMDAKNEHLQAKECFERAWKGSANAYEKFMTAYFLAGQQHSAIDRLKWLCISLDHALQVDDPGVKAALPALYRNIADAYAQTGDVVHANKYNVLANECSAIPVDNGPFFHGTKADLNIGDLLTPGIESNYQADLKMNHIYFTALPNGAGLAASLAKGQGRERVYVVEPTGDFEHDPNVTDKKFPGNLTRSYRSSFPLKIVGELNDWTKQTSAEISKWKDRLAENTGEIIN